MAALVGHPTLASLSLEGNPPWGGDEGGGEGAAASRRAAGEALARLVAAAAAAPGRGGSPLRRLRLALCLLGDAGLRPVVAALRGCAAAAGLADLDIGFNAVSRGFAAGELLPAVAANASLRRLEVGVEAPDTQAPLDQAAALVAARAAAAAGGA